MVNNDRKNCLTRVITKMSKDALKKGNVVGIYLHAFTEENEKQIEIVSVVDEITEEWERLWKEQPYQRMVTARVHNIEVFPSVVQASQFSRICMHHREEVLAQELKNSYIIYDGESEWEEAEKFLEDLRESFLNDKDLPFYKNRLEISPKLIKNIRQELLRRRRIYLFRNNERELRLSRNEENRIVDKNRLRADKKLYQIQDLLSRYSDFELGEGFPHYDSEKSDFTNQYLVLDDENLKLFQKLQAKTTSSNYDLDHIFEQMKQSPNDQFTEEEKQEFFSRCLSYLEEGFEKIHPIDYFEEEERETYQKLKSIGEKK